ncbi:MAG: class I SAM-dependent methyltransferase [Planctomycetota bacterium]
MSSTQCPVCSAQEPEPFARFSAVPVHVGVLWPDEESARNCSRGDIWLTHCESCQLIRNLAFDDSKIDYGLKYDNALHFSSVFQEYERNLADRLIETYGIRGKNVVEIGCGGGHFLGLLCERGDNGGAGFDPSHDAENADPAVRNSDNVQVLREYYSADHGEYPADLLCCRHVLEHIPSPAEFLGNVRNALLDQPEAILYFEVPNADFILGDLSIWDVIYEHTLYFTAAALRNIFETCGFEVLALEPCYDNQFLGLEARVRRDWQPGAPAVGDHGANTKALVAAMARHIETMCQDWGAKLQQHAAAGENVVVWGGGAKTVTFLNLMGESASAVTQVVDVNPGKQGSFIAGSGHEILAPAALEASQPHTVIVMNPIYRDEIEADLKAMGLNPQVVAV